MGWEAQGCRSLDDPRAQAVPPQVEVTPEPGAGSERGGIGGLGRPGAGLELPLAPRAATVLRDQAHGLAVPGGNGVPVSPSCSAAPRQTQPWCGRHHLPLCLRAGGGSSGAAGAAVPARDPPIPPPGRGAHGAWGGLEGWWGGSGAKLGVLTPLSLSSLEQGDRGIPHHPLRTQVTPPPWPPLGLPTLLNKEAAALALVFCLLCTQCRENPHNCFRGPPYTRLEAPKCPQGGCGVPYGGAQGGGGRAGPPGGVGWEGASSQARTSPSFCSAALGRGRGTLRGRRHTARTRRW